jgi:hypothetical protein
MYFTEKKCIPGLTETEMPRDRQKNLVNRFANSPTTHAKPPLPLSHLSTLLSHLYLSLPSLLLSSARTKPSNPTQTRCATAHLLHSSIIIFEI